VNNKRILLVDDVSSMRDVIKAFLRQGKHSEVDEAHDGHHAFQMIERRKYALVVCDFEMPKLNGIELLKKIRAEKKMRHVQFIMVTSHNHADKIKAAIDNGVNDYIAKPFQPGKLLKKVARCLSNRQAAIAHEQAQQDLNASDEIIALIDDSLDEIEIEIEI